jgi:hypothetical protein
LILWLTIALDVLAILATWLIPGFSLPRWIYSFILIVGIFWSGYKKYSISLPKAETPNTQIESVEPEISLGFVKGNEYSFQYYISKWNSAISNEVAIESFKNEKDNQNIDVCFPFINLLTHIRIENIGQIPVTIIGVESKTELFSPFTSISLTREIFIDGKEIHYPIIMNPAENFGIRHRDLIRPSPYYTSTQFAVGIRKMHDDKFCTKSTIFIEYLSSNDEPKEKKASQEIVYINVGNVFESLKAN